MKKDIQQEILFAKNSSFVQRELHENNLSVNNKQPRTYEANKLEEACWNGMMRKWLPVVNRSIDYKKLFLWKVFVANTFLCAELSGRPLEINSPYSLNPYLFLSLKNNN